MTHARSKLSVGLSSHLLNHGQAERVIGDTRLMESKSSTALDAMIKKLRRNGIPFSNDELVKDTLKRPADGPADGVVDLHPELASG